MTRFIDTNIFVYTMTAHPRFGKTAKQILERVEKGEKTATSTLVLCEIAWVLEAMGRQGDIKPTLEKIMSYRALEILGYNEEDLILGANHMSAENIDFNDGVNLALMTREGIFEVYSNDQKHLGRIDGLRLFFE